MCTATWFHQKEGFELFFNRDERLTRLPARAPREQVVEGVRMLAPTDGDAGGTWIAVNEFGLALALLNAWQVEVPIPVGGFQSRGNLVRGLSASADLRDLRARMESFDLSLFQGFTLLVIAQGSDAVSLGWNGKDLACSAPKPPLVSNSLDAAEALKQRSLSFQRQCASITDPVQRRSRFEAFHRSQEPEPGPWAVCMRREDARTVSASHVEVTPAGVSMRYADGPPDITLFGNTLRLERRRAKS